MGTPRKSGRQRKVLDYKRLAKGLSFDDDSKSSEDEEIKFTSIWEKIDFGKSFANHSVKFYLFLF